MDSEKDNGRKERTEEEKRKRRLTGQGRPGP